MKASLALENGFVCTGLPAGAEGEICGEIVFNTGLSGYQEILTDPSYCGQIVTMTSPMIGNYGVNSDDPEGPSPVLSGFVMREYIDFPSNFRSEGALGDYLKKHRIVAIHGVDTRMLTRMIREKGAMRAIISTVDHSPESLIKKVCASPMMAGLDLASRVTCREPYDWNDAGPEAFRLAVAGGKATGSEHLRVAVYDYGVKRNILRRLALRGCVVRVVPAGYPAEKLLQEGYHGVMLSNGPGDPAAVTYAVEHIRTLLGKIPVFGICLGHQLLALALGGKTFKLKFGHRGLNHPVKHLATGVIEITSQNHGFAVEPNSLDPSAIEITHTNLNDGTNEGFRHRTLPAFSVQYHPESAPGPHDSDYLFDSFLEMMRCHTPKKASK
jgi:carbamoyl-phosphate synthase small subunit